MQSDYSRIQDYRPQIQIRRLLPSDAQSIYENVKDKAIVRYTLQIPHPYHFKDARAFINQSNRQRRQKTAYVFGIELLKPQHKYDKKGIIGVISLSKIDRKHKHCELGYWLGKHYWSRGIMSKAVNMILDFAFQNLKMHRVYASAFASNTASLRVLEKNDFLLEGILFEVFWRNQTWHNLFMYGILKNNYFNK